MAGNISMSLFSVQTDSADGWYRNMRSAIKIKIDRKIGVGVQKSKILVKGLHCIFLNIFLYISSYSWWPKPVPSMQITLDHFLYYAEACLFWVLKISSVWLAYFWRCWPRVIVLVIHICRDFLPCEPLYENHSVPFCITLYQSCLGYNRPSCHVST